MKRGVHIFVSLVAVVLLARPFDCFATAQPSREAMDCCLKGKCGPSAKSDECCQNSSPDKGQFTIAKTGQHFGPQPVLAPASTLATVPDSSSDGSIDLMRHPPPMRGFIARSLPLLI